MRYRRFSLLQRIAGHCPRHVCRKGSATDTRPLMPTCARRWRGTPAALGVCRGWPDGYLEGPPNDLTDVVRDSYNGRDNVHPQPRVTQGSVVALRRGGLVGLSACQGRLLGGSRRRLQVGL